MKQELAGAEASRVQPGSWHHSCRNASTGSRREAVTAGQAPKNRPAATEKQAVATAQPST